MNQNYHKRLGNYLSEPKYGLRRASSQHSYMTAARTKFQNSTRNTYVYNSNLYQSKRPDGAAFCPLCTGEQNQNRYECGHYKTGQQPGTGNMDEMASSEYFAPEIKTIRNTLLDIRDQMKHRNKNRKGFDYAGATEKEEFGDTFEEANKKLSMIHQRELNSKIQEKNRKNRDLQLKIDQLQAIVQQFQRKTRQLEDDKSKLQARLQKYEQQVEEQRNRANRAQNQKIIVQQRQRTLQLKIMDLRAQLMRKQQALRDLSFNQQQQRHSETTRRMMMGPSQEVSMLVNWGQYKQSKASQTLLSEVDIEGGYRELNQMQDSLCDRINSNLKVEKKIFARIQEIDGRLGDAYDVLHRMQQQALRMGINVL